MTNLTIMLHHNLCQDFKQFSKLAYGNSVKWDLIIKAKIPTQQEKDQGLPTFRTLPIEGEDIEFSKGFTDLHTVSYHKILTGEGYGLADAKSSIEIVSEIRNN